MNKQKGFLRLTLVLSIIVGVLSGVIGYIAADQPNPFDDIIPDTKLNFTPNLFPEQPNIFDDILPDKPIKKLTKTKMNTYEVIDNTLKENAKIILGDSGSSILKHFDLGGSGKKKK